MKSSTGPRLTMLAASLAALALTSACSGSSGGSAPSQSKVEAKLKTESDFKSLASETGKKAEVGNKVISCIAKTLEKDATPSSLNDYVNGKIKPDDIKFKSGSSSDAKSDAESCTKSVLKQSGLGG